MKVRGVIIAAGESSRFGAAKALLEVEGGTVLSRVAGALSLGGCDDLLIVCGGTYQKSIEEESERISVRSVVNVDPADGPISSIRVAMESPGEWDAILIHPVDVVGVKSTDVSGLIESFRKEVGAFDVWVVSHQMRRGHPLLVVREKVVRLLEKDGPPHLRALLAQDDVRIQHVVTDNSLVLEDVDDREDWDRIYPLLTD
ncbi:MAG: NTP transferase domain-containing protein [Planctomycetota bacterium]